MSEGYAPAIGRGLDALPGIASSGAIEIGGVPQFVSSKVGDITYHRIPQLQFPADKDGHTVLMQNVTAYSKQALWNKVNQWMNGGTAPSGLFDSRGSFLSKVKANPLEVTQGSKEKSTGVNNWVKTTALDNYTFGLEWKHEQLVPWTKTLWKGRFPSYFKHQGTRVEAIPEASVPNTANLKMAKFPSPDTKGTYQPSEKGEGVWMNPGPRLGPFTTKLVDGSVVTYYWYRFIDQPALQNAGLDSEKRDKLQKLVEKMHRSWTLDKQYLAPPTRGQLAAIDTALLVKPPIGLEIGYVPVAIRQNPAKD